MSPHQQLVPLESHLLQKLLSHKATHKPMVAFSGGVDSFVLLFALIRLRELKLVTDIKAVHVNHGLQADANNWQKYCHQFCNKHNVQLLTNKLNLGESCQSNIEGLAREGRYQFFKSVLQNRQCLLMAHHVDDQAETLLFRLLRGCGISGASAMPEKRELGQGFLLRPFLEVSKNEIKQYAQLMKLKWIEDPSNQSSDFDRNFLRLQILPLLREKWPSCSETFSRFSRLAREQSLLLTEIAQEDYASCEVARGKLCVVKLKLLSPVRCKNLLHFWGNLNGVASPSNKEIEELLKQINSSHHNAIDITFAGCRAKRFANQLMLAAKNQPDAQFDECEWHNILKPIILSNGLKVTALSSNQPGLRFPMNDEKVKVIRRCGGERCLPEYRNKTTELKKIYQELRVPDWERKWLPIIYYNNKIAAVPGVFICQEFVSDGVKTPSLQLLLQGKQE
ncbi:tRNA lysidine(34) synthetase TilS [Aliikangiella sp. IMCC44359]|uniref:tRNA lysidine(34) synthetase TilS n=1 Tax=Aliikangiella sp. IMCC44359 TaxID=3459125 RepID=UPI00403B1D3A